MLGVFFCSNRPNTLTGPELRGRNFAKANLKAVSTTILSILLQRTDITYVLISQDWWSLTTNDWHLSAYLNVKKVCGLRLMVRMAKCKCSANLDTVYSLSKISVY